MQGIGRLLVVSGIILFIIGIILLIGDKIPYIGRLPGDIYIRKERFSFYFPVSTCIIISLILSFLLWILRK